MRRSAVDVFDSADSERDRGERKASDAATRMQWFVNQVGLRKLATRMRHKEGRVALEHFVALNIRLLNLKRFSEANEEAARKILKVRWGMTGCLMLRRSTTSAAA